MQIVGSMPKFQYHTVPINKIKCDTIVDKHGRKIVKKVHVDGVETQPSSRFWNSLCSRFGFNTSIFKLFSHSEVFERINREEKNSDVKVTVAHSTRWNNETKTEMPHVELLSAINPNATMLHDDEAMQVLGRLDTTSIQYTNGRLVSTHTPRRRFEFDLGTDEKYHSKLMLETPIDGYGSPATYLALLRIICVNMGIGYNKTFKSKIILGKEAEVDSMTRMMEAFNNEDGFAMIKERLVMAQKSWASVYECHQLGKAIACLELGDFKSEFRTDDARTRCYERLGIMTGDVHRMWGFAQVNTISERKLRSLPTKCTVYDLLNFITEIATHQLDTDAGIRFQTLYGEKIARDFDLEGSCDSFADFADFIDPKSKEAAQAAKTEQN